MMQKIQRFGGAMIVPVLLLAFNGIILALSTVFQNPDIVGSIATEGTFWSNIWGVIEEGGWTVFNNMELLFVIGLPISLAKKASGRAVLESFVIYMTWNTFMNAILETWNFGVDLSDPEAIGIKSIGGVTTLDTSIIGAILIAGVAIYLHNRFYDTALPEWLGVFSGSSFVVILGFIAALPLAFLAAWVWPPIQDGIAQLQGFMASSGTIGVGIYVFLERILIPTGLHHFIYQPFDLGPAVVQGGTISYWFEHLSEFANSTESLRELFPGGGFGLQNVSKVFAPIGIGGAFIATSKPENRQKTMALVIPTALTAILSGITEPFEFTFLFLAPQLFAVHALLAASMSMIMYALGVSASIGGGFIANFSQFILPMWANHKDAIFIFLGVGLAFSVIYYFLFRWAIVRFNIKTPGREDSGEVKMYSKKDFKEKQAAGSVAMSSVRESDNPNAQKAAQFIEGLGGAQNITDVTNCATRLRVSVADEGQVLEDDFFKGGGAHGVVRNGKAFQVIVGLDVPKVREFFEEIVEDENKNYEGDE
ncbi:alpha-glucoside-specific PTS transporter subunit IIBC [Tetragenococcus halophilus]|uniref:Alpha-glucoside-specific phosphotransferase enzyme IIB component n=1 Tax=Tetragenococcus halophilus TaxID=51669 RepID=A0A3G5FJ40_TETHA|nr:alpha-glucoside-specific PTS transporter subunit IIBC [Tetragenococcus halophilus]AOF48691.1 PTS alpha-glucoside transporter subunit IIBC [Tetragenococcus halophilus]AYW50291.1 alpha-glucoside-specific phosphotransferase enzyme IIB component [Tetragenococcus halophilus]MCO8293098.1 PTS transporter subunit EIIC [Tetragenococcus halophilus]MDN6724285.1 alpha-glucoside-specific PTS transporter subunit IIBC [Tetragenococcus halophilus]GBD63494.1 alpha-glucoside-specific phosphotransferase syste